MTIAVLEYAWSLTIKYIISMNIYTSTKVLPYVYICTHKESGEFYIGYREANKEPSYLDFPKYKTSKDIVHNNFDSFNWSIIAEFFDGESAYDFEQRFIYENWSNPLLINESCYYGTTQFRLSPAKISIFMKTKWQNMTAEEKSNYLAPLNKQDTKWMTKDGEFTMVHISAVEEYLMLGWSIGCRTRNKGFTSLKSTLTNEVIRVPSNLKDQYLQSGWAHLNSGIGKFKWYTNGIVNRRLKLSDIIPNGFKPGRTI